MSKWPDKSLAVLGIGYVTKISLGRICKEQSLPDANKKKGSKK